ncbi:MAG: hypothetical protein LUQ01_00385, partial [Methanolinea sp.]|nr:hypothetical protein [Methanolinea sp.]
MMGHVSDTIGIGIANNPGKVISSVEKSGLASRIICYGRPGTLSGLTTAATLRETTEPEQELVRDL